MLLTDRGSCHLLDLVRIKSLGYQTPRYHLGQMRLFRLVPKCTIDPKVRRTAVMIRTSVHRGLTKQRKFGMLRRWK